MCESLDVLGLVGQRPLHNAQQCLVCMFWRCGILETKQDHKPPHPCRFTFPLPLSPHTPHHPLCIPLIVPICPSTICCTYPSP